MSIQAVVTLIKSVVVDPVYPNGFPATAATKCLMVEVTQGFSRDGDLFDLDIGVYCRAATPAEAESMSQKCLNALAGKTDIDVNGVQIVRLAAQSPMPIYDGMDENNLYYYRVDYRALASYGFGK